MKKRIIGFCLAASLILSVIVPSFASDKAISGNTSAENELIALVNNMLPFIEMEKEQYGMKDVDFSTLYLGSEIPAYVLEIDGELSKPDISYFPIMSNDKWVATVMAFYSKSGKLNIQISSYYVQEYAESSCKDKNFALIFDRDGAYFYADGNVELAAASTYNMPSLSSIKEHPDMAVQSTANLRPQHVLTVVRDNIVSTQSGPEEYFDRYYYLDVPTIKQAEDSLQCWAACVASIRKYYGTNTTIDDVYNKANIKKYEAGNIGIAENVLEAYGLSPIFFRDDQLSWDQFRSKILFDNTPFFASCILETETAVTERPGHAVVLRGYVAYRNVSQLGSISYMDPYTGAYGASIVVNDFEYYYIPGGNALTLRIASVLQVCE